MFINSSTNWVPFWFLLASNDPWFCSRSHASSILRYVYFVCPLGCDWEKFLFASYINHFDWACRGSCFCSPYRRRVIDSDSLNTNLSLQKDLSQWYTFVDSLRNLLDRVRPVKIATPCQIQSSKFRVFLRLSKTGEQLGRLLSCEPVLWEPKHLQGWLSGQKSQKSIKEATFLPPSCIFTQI